MDDRSVEMMRRDMAAVSKLLAQYDVSFPTASLSSSEPTEVLSIASSEHHNRALINWRRIRSAIEHGNALVNYRINWVLLSQGLILTAFAAPCARPDKKPSPTREPCPLESDV